MPSAMRKALLAFPLIAILFAPVPALAALSAPGRISVVQVTAASFDPNLKHNVANLTVTISDQSGSANFLDYYNGTGGLTRWGYPTSEVFQEEPGNLAQYFQRGVVDWHWRADLKACDIDRRLAWDYFGGDRAGAGSDQGTEPGTSNPSAGDQSGPWGHVVSDVAVNGQYVGFKSFFEKLGGVQSFGYPKSEARVDTNASGTLHINAATPGCIRQYFQSAVMEYHPDTPGTPVQLRLLGDDLRDKNYANGGWKSNLAFEPASEITAGQSISLYSLTDAPLTAGSFQVSIPSSVAQGHTFQLKVIAPSNASVSATLDGKSLKIFPQGSVWLAYVGFDPQADIAGHSVTVSDGQNTVTRRFNVTGVNWPVESITTNDQQNQVTSGNNVADENTFLRPYFLTYTPKPLWSGKFAYPVQAPLTDGFGVFRSYNGGPADTYHEGRDLGAWTGTPIYAPAAGKVVIARPLTVRGNGVIIDHGLGVFTGYYHQSKLAVQEGQAINKGDLIGYVGDTGFANGPHLHWELRVGNRYVDPDEWTKATFGVGGFALEAGPSWADIIPYRSLLE